jgi:DNA-binding transcriptional MerR regulator
MQDRSGYTYYVTGGLMIYSIGEFSRISNLSIKALRLYHEKELLVPSAVDKVSGYRYYDKRNVERALIITRLREMDFSLGDIGEMLSDVDEEDEVVDFFERKAAEILRKIDRQKQIVRTLRSIIKSEKENRMSQNAHEFSVEEKDVDTILMAGVRFRGKYSDCGEAFGKIGKVMGPTICGKAFNLYYEKEYKEDNVDMESGMPIRKGKVAEGVSVRELQGCRCVCLIHKGPYDTLGRSYEKIMGYIKEKGYTYELPTREVYLKGPGMIFAGKPENYLTEIQFPIGK